MKKPPAQKVRKVQKHLFDYLSIDLDPYDFPHYFLEQWGEEAGVEIGEDDHADSLTKEQLAAYEQWLRDKEKAIEWVEKDPFGSAPYLTFRWAERMPTGTWGIHFTKDIFDTFEKGAELYGLHLSTWAKEKKIADCKTNLDPDNSPYSTIWGFAFQAVGAPGGWSRNIISYGKSRYGQNAVLFQTDGAVRVYHDGDEEYQLIFPLCSEYNIVPLADPESGSVGCTLRNGEEVQFPSIQALIEYLEKDGERKIPSRIKTLDC
jgi:hypothetical protein